MQVVKMPQTDITAVAPGCFDLPMVQALTIEKVVLENGEIEYHSTPRLITHWIFSEEEWEKLSKQEVKGVYLHVISAQTPPVLVDINEPFSTWPDIVPLKEYVKGL